MISKLVVRFTNINKEEIFRDEILKIFLHEHYLVTLM